MKSGKLKALFLYLRITGKMKGINAALKNRKTTISGIVAALGGLSTILVRISDGIQQADAEPIGIAIGAIAGGIGLLFSRDADKSSRDSGIE